MTHPPPPGAPRARIPGPQQPPPPYPRIRPGLWRRCLGGGLALWALTTLVTYTTADTALLPTLIPLGGFLLPVTFVLWAYERHARDLGVSAVLGCFLAGGALGVLGASAAEYHLLHPSPWTFAAVGPVEETLKLGALMFALRRLSGIRGMRAGLALGAAVGFGFAALESWGHTLEAAVVPGDAGLRALLGAELLRGVLAPLGQGLWTAVAGGVLLAHRRPNGRFRLGGPVLGAWLGVCLLHALWDSAHGYLPRPAAAVEHLFTVFSVGGPVLVPLLGIAWACSPARRGTSWRNTP